MSLPNMVQETEVVTSELDFVLVEERQGPKGDKGDPGDVGDISDADISTDITLIYNIAKL